MPLPVATRADPALLDRRFAPDVEAAAYYVVCEAHQCRQARGRPDRRRRAVAANGHLTVVVCDNGSGAPEPGHGQRLTNLRHRVVAVGGRLQVDGIKDRLGDVEEPDSALREVTTGGPVIDPTVVDALVVRQNRAAPSRLAALSARELECCAR